MSYHSDIGYDILFKKTNIEKIENDKVRKEIAFCVYLLTKITA